MPELTPTQQHVLTELRRRGQSVLAEDIKKKWETRRMYFFDEPVGKLRALQGGLAIPFGHANTEHLMENVRRAIDGFYKPTHHNTFP